MYVQETMVSVDLKKHTLFTVNPKTGCAARLSLLAPARGSRWRGDTRTA